MRVPARCGVRRERHVLDEHVGPLVPHRAHDRMRAEVRDVVVRGEEEPGGTVAGSTSVTCVASAVLVPIAVAASAWRR